MTNHTEQRPAEEVDWAAENTADEKVIADTADMLSNKYKVAENSVNGMIDEFTNTGTIACQLGDIMVTRGPEHTMLISRVGEEANVTLEVVGTKASEPTEIGGEEKKAA